MYFDSVPMVLFHMAIVYCMKEISNHANQYFSVEKVVPWLDTGCNNTICLVFVERGGTTFYFPVLSKMLKDGTIMNLYQKIEHVIQFFIVARVVEGGRR